jgi:hypothetical protein
MYCPLEFFGFRKNQGSFLKNSKRPFAIFKVPASAKTVLFRPEFSQNFRKYRPIPEVSGLPMLRDVAGCVVNK